ncbi:MAG: exodeoxyribonuclease VII large subunit [Bernardetiaceae bacterium]|nr:exodeoxyribonuclease VII large subunit [Bernardetiaceae bacterium]
MANKHFTLLQLNKSIQKLIQGVQQTFWVTAELATVQITEHAYLELVQKEGEKMVAKARAVVWNQRLTQVLDKIGPGAAELLKPGNRVLLLVAVSFHEVHGLALVVQDLDPAYTLGELEQQRLKTLKTLENNGLMYQQATLALPLVIQRVAVVTSATAAGYSDFVNQLTANDFGYRFSLKLFAASVQGERAVDELVAQLAKVGQTGPFDAVVLVRGGGSRLDLEVFNHYAVAEAIARCPVPVLTGIGHLRDSTVADAVAAVPLKTPTAVAEFIVQRNLAFESLAQRTFAQLLAGTQAQVTHQRLSLTRLAERLPRTAQARLQQQQALLARQQARLPLVVKHQLAQAGQQLAFLTRSLAQLDPSNILKRGYSITLRQGQVVGPQNPAQPGDELVTLTHQAAITSQVTQLGPANPVFSFA